MEQQQVIDKLKETLEAVKEGEGSIDARAGNAAALKKIAHGQRLLIDCMVGLLQVGALEPEPDVEIEEEPEPENEFDVDKLKAVYEPKKAKRK